MFPIIFSQNKNREQAKALKNHKLEVGVPDVPDVPDNFIDMSTFCGK